VDNRTQPQSLNMLIRASTPEESVLVPTPDLDQYAMPPGTWSSIGSWVPDGELNDTRPVHFSQAPLPLLPRQEQALLSPLEHSPSSSVMRRREGIEGRKEFFTTKEDDKSIQAVQKLLLKWTTVDDPVPPVEVEQQSLLVNVS
jgi:hypothetical protein